MTHFQTLVQSQYIILITIYLTNEYTPHYINYYECFQKSLQDLQGTRSMHIIIMNPLEVNESLLIVYNIYVHHGRQLFNTQHSHRLAHCIHQPTSLSSQDLGCIQTILILICLHHFSL